MWRDPAARAGGEATSSVVIERPPPGLARGKHPASAWVIGLLGTLALLSVVTYFVIRIRRRPRS